MQAVTAAWIWVEYGRVLKGGSVMANGLAERGVPVGETAIVMGIELSKKGWLVALRGPLADRISLHRLRAGDAKGLLTLARRAQFAAAEALGTEVSIASCYEAGYDGFWLHRVLSAANFENHVIDPASIHVDRRARRVKTDRIDAQALLRTLMAHRRGESRVWSVVQPPTPEDEDRKRPHRERQNLLKERGRHVNRIKGLCSQQGILDYEPMRADRHQRLAELETRDGRQLQPLLLAEIRRELARLEFLLAQIAELETARETAIKAESSEDTGPVQTQRVQSLRHLVAIGPETSTVLANEVFYRRFTSRRHLAAYVGLTPSPHMSGGLSREQGISKAGNPRARTALVEAAWLWLRYQPKSALSKWFAQRVGEQRGRIRRIMVVALARKLLVALWRYVETGLVPTGATLRT
jgi:transposase